MSSLFDSYEKEFKRNLLFMNERVDKLNSLTGSALATCLQEAEESMRACCDILEKLDFEARNLSDNGAVYRARVKTFRADIDAAKRQITKVKSFGRPTSARDELFSKGEEHVPQEEVGAQRQRLLDTTSKLNKGTEQIRGAIRTAQETEAIGQAVMNDLQAQRESLLRSKNAVQETNTDLDRSNKLLQSISRRSMLHKIVLGGIASVLVIIIIAVLVNKYGS